jgi:UDP-N-acetylglucosamine 2-epimerase (non-hydrolysing)
VVHVTGNTAIDALLTMRRRLAAQGGPLPPPAWLTAPGPLVLITAHRRENLGAPLSRIAAAVHDLARRFPETRFVLPLHPNPDARAALQTALNPPPANVHLVEPLDYPLFVAALDRCSLILSDSGGIQEEAPSLGKHVLVLRDTTERPEAVEAGTATLVGTQPERIVGEATLRLTSPHTRADEQSPTNPFGDGQAALRMARAIGIALNDPRQPAP